MYQLRKLSTLKKLPNNPRIIRDADFERLCTSLESNPEYFQGRPLLLSDRTGELIIIAGNQRFEAAKEIGLKEVPTFLIEGLTEEKEKEIIVRDNVNNGQWDWEALANEWNVEDLSDWGVNIPNFEKEADYSILGEDENDEVDAVLDDMANGVKKAIQIEFEPEHYEEAKELVKFFREKEAYIGLLLIEKLKDEKEKM